MNTARKIEIVEETIRLYKELDKSCDDFCRLVNATIDKGLLDAVWRCVEFHRNHSAELIGDDCGMLDWYIFDNECGSKNLTVKIKGRNLLVNTPAKFVKVMEMLAKD